MHFSTAIFNWAGTKRDIKTIIVSHLLFVVWLGLGLSCLLGSILFKDIDKGFEIQNLTQIKNLINLAISDYFCVGSNLWLYMCSLLVPNILVIVQVQLFG